MELLEGFNIYLVRSKPTLVWDKKMKNVVTVLKGIGLHPEWKSPEEILETTLSNKIVVVMADFNCEHFNDFDSTECLVVGPDCLLECIEKRISIPNNESAVFNMAMSNLVVSCSNMSKKKKDDIKKYVGWMGGCYTNHFTVGHTHLIADTMNSEKCHAAADSRKRIMSSVWVEKVWESSLKDSTTRADNEEFINQYLLPTFKGLEITLSNLNPATKKKLKKLIQDNGGECVGSLTQHQTHYVITDKCEGEKVKCAIAWGGVHIVSEQWVENSILAHGPLSPKNYAIKQRPTCSTPTSELPSFMSADISVVDKGNITVGSGVASQPNVEETMNTTTGSSVASYVPNLIKPKPIKATATATVVPSTPVPNSTTKSQPTQYDYDNYRQIVEGLNPSDVSRAGSFLDGCKICLIGWNPNEGDKLRRLLVKGGATVLTKMTRSVTHVIAAKMPKDLSSNSCQNIVKIDWVIASMQEGHPVECAPYLLLPAAQSKPPPPSPLSHKGLSLLKSKETEPVENPDETNDLTFKPPVSRQLFEKTPKKKLMSREESCVGNNSIEEQRIDVNDQNTLPSKLNREEEAMRHPVPNPTNDTQKSNATYSQISDVTNNKIFLELKFIILGFDTESSASVIKEIEDHGGSVVPSNFQGVPDYAVLPIEGVPDKINALEVVNCLWIEDCIEQSTIVDIQYYHQPVSILATCDILSAATICLSGFLRQEKLYLTHLAIMLGARVQEAFSRKDNPVKNVLRSTHLISCEPSGSKYEAAVKWGVPAVGKAWLLQAASKPDSEPPPLSPYLLSKQQDPDEIVDKTPLNTNKSKSACSDTPVSSRIVSQLSKTKSYMQDKSNLANEATSEPEQLNFLKNQESEKLDSITPKAKSFSKDSRSSINMFSTPGGSDDATKGNLDLQFSNGVGVKRTSRDRSPLKEHTLNTSSSFNTPHNLALKHAKLDISVDRSPFHVDTPEEPLGSVFYSNPDKKTSKIYKKFIDSFPDCKPETPVISKKKSSPPFGVLKKQILAQIGFEVDGIDKGTGKLIKGGAYSEWANSSTESSFNSPAPGGLNNSNRIVEETPLINRKNSGSSSDSERKKSTNDNVNELLQRLDDIKNTNNDHQLESNASIKKFSGRLQAAPNQEQDLKSHPLNKIRPNSADLFSAQRPSASSYNKESEMIVSSRSSLDKNTSSASQRDLENEDTQPPDGTPTQPVPKKLFMLSSLPAESKEKYEGIICSLGGEVSGSSIFEEASTHLVIEIPVRNEKLLCSIASGKWVLHTSYLDQCYERRCFIPEEPYEWGNPASESRLPKVNDSQKEKLAKAAYRWRRSCSNLNQKAFRQMKAMLICRESSKPMFTRLLLSGGAQIVDDPSQCNICLVEETKVELSKTLFETLAIKSVPCVPLLYLSIYLVDFPNCNPSDYLVQQYIPYYKKK